MTSEIPPPSGALDLEHDRRAAGAVKHLWFPADKIPMWVADMEFRCAQPVLDSIAEAAGKGDFGYVVQPPALPQVACARLKAHYGYDMPDDSRFKWLPAIVMGLGMAVRCSKRASGESHVVICSPIYRPFMETPARYGAAPVLVPLQCRVDGTNLHYEIDWAALETALARDETTLLYWCSPHNPVGRCWTRDELHRIASLCVAHNVVLCSDEVWGESALDPATTPFTSFLALLPGREGGVPGLDTKLIVLTSPSKVFNVAAVAPALAVVPDSALFDAFSNAHFNENSMTPFGYAAVMGAWGDAASEQWRQRLVAYLRSNRDHAVATLQALPGVRLAVPEAGCLLWIDLTDALPDDTSAFDHLMTHGVAASDGAPLGVDGRGHVRLNFGCLRATLDSALERICASLNKRGGATKRLRDE